MKTFVVLAALVALSLAATLPPYQEVETKAVDAEFVLRQKKVFSLLKNVAQVDQEAEWYKVGKEYDIEANIDKYTNKKVVEDFLVLYRTGLLPKYKVFSIFDERLREETVALYNLFYYAKDFETFYKTAAWARVYLNEYQFMYTFYITIIQRQDTQGIVVPAPYEVFPEFFTNSEAIFKAYRVKMQDGLLDEKLAQQYGVIKENVDFVFYANYSNYLTYGTEEQKLAYFTEDVGLNSYYYYFHSILPFWTSGEIHGIYKERRGEIYYYFYQQILARYYLERLSNGLGEIPDFSWYKPIKQGYVPFMSTLYYPFIQRNDYYTIPVEKYTEELQFLDTYEKTFIQYLQRGQFKAFNQEIDLMNSKAINFIGNYWESNPDLYERTAHQHFHRSYEIVARHLLSAVPEYFEKGAVLPAALNFYQTSMRDPMFYQLYSKIIKYFLQYKEHLVPYTQENLHYVGVKINDVRVEKLITYFDFFEYDITNGVYKSVEEIKNDSTRYLIRQPRLNHKPFTVTIDVKSDVESEAVFKIFLGPKYDSNGYPISLEDNWMNFVELDWFKQKVTVGQNKIERSSDDFFYFKDYLVPTTQIYQYLEQGKLPKGMSEKLNTLPNRLILPKGTEGGYPFQLFVFVYPYQGLDKEYESYIFTPVDNKPFGYPFDRPVNEVYFKQPNMFFEDVKVYFEGEHFPYVMNTPYYVSHQNVVPKH